jgi:hypothetical protein
VQKEKSDSTTKFGETYFMFTFITNQIRALHLQSNGWRKDSKTAGKSSLQPMRSVCLGR